MKSNAEAAVVIQFECAIWQDVRHMIEKNKVAVYWQTTQHKVQGKLTQSKERLKRVS